MHAATRSGTRWRPAGARGRTSFAPPPTGERGRGEGTEASRSGLPDFNLPALCPFPEQSLLFEVAEAGRTEAVDALRAVMFRLLTALPPGKVRFTILDP